LPHRGFHFSGAERGGSHGNAASRRFTVCGVARGGVGPGGKEQTRASDGNELVPEATAKVRRRGVQLPPPTPRYLRLRK
jgi:hypothetical protein